MAIQIGGTTVIDNSRNLTNLGSAITVSQGGTGVQTITGILKGSGTSNITAAAAGTDYVTPTGTETLSNKTLTGATLNSGYSEQEFAITGTTPALSPVNGSIQTWTLTGSSTPVLGTWSAGQSITFMIDDGASYTVNWANISPVWKTNGGTAPTLQTTGFTAIVLWKVGTTIYGARVGDA